MAASSRKSSTGTEYSRIYSARGGVDFTGDGSLISPDRFAYLENMYRDYDGDGPGVLESVPGFRRLTSFPDKINSIFSYKDKNGNEYTVVHAGESLYRFRTQSRNGLSSLSPIASLPNTKSRAFTSDDCLYILTGNGILRLDGSGNVSTLGSDHEPYIPITYYNGEPYEQRNLLSERFIERYTVSYPDSVAAGSEGLVFRITDRESGFCALDDGRSARGAIYVPSRVTIDGAQYVVTEVSPYAFSSNNAISTISLPEGVEKIGNGAFSGCALIGQAFLPSTLKSIGSRAFSGCLRLNDLYLGAALEFIGEDAFADAAVGVAHYPLDTESYAKITGVAELAGISIEYGSRYAGMRARIPIFSLADSISYVKINGEDLSYMGGPVYKTVGNSRIITAYEFTVPKKEELINATIEISGIYHTDSRFENKYSSDFFTTESGFAGRGADAICGCRICESFDGRIFLAANPNLPNTVFYSSRDRTGKNNPTYFGVFNYFSDGTGRFPVTSLLATGDSLAVFKAGDDGGGSIYYHEPSATGDNILSKVYPVSYIHRGMNSLGESISFFDDPVFISSLGLAALDKKALYLERSISCRSHNVNPRLLTERLERIKLAKWLGYLVLSVDGRMYLADSRATFTHSTGSREYEWYYLSGIGTYKDALSVYRYADTAPEGYTVNTGRVGEEPSVYIYSRFLDFGQVYYTIENGIKYIVEKSAETKGGEFYPATEIYSDGELLFFGTNSGDLCIFNNDMRGTAPERMIASTPSDKSEYEEYNTRRIHPEFYSFDNRPVRYAVKSAFDNCGIPHLSKDTVRGSLTLKIKSFSKTNLTLEVGTDRGAYKEVETLSGGELSFTDIDFSCLPFENKDSQTLPFKEKEKRWVEKQISVYADAFCSPIGIYSMAYRFTVRGKIKA